MKLIQIPLLTDENIEPDVVSYLRSEGFDVYDILENGLVGMDDEQILELAHHQNRVVVTHDSDFGKLAIAEAKPFSGIVYLKPGHIKTAFTLQSLKALINKVPEVIPPFIVVVHHGKSDIRIRYRQK